KDDDDSGANPRINLLQDANAADTISTTGYRLQFDGEDIEFGDGGGSNYWRFNDGSLAPNGTATLTLPTGGVTTVRVNTLLDVNEDVDIDFSANDQEMTISQSVTYNDAGEAQVIIENTAGDITAQSYLLRLQYTDNADPDADFMVMEDNGGDDMITFTDGGAGTFQGLVTAVGGFTANAEISIIAAEPDLVFTDSTDSADARIRVDSNDADDVVMVLQVDDGNSDDASYIELDGVGQIVHLNDGGVDIDVTVEGVDATSLFHVDAGSNDVMVTRDLASGNTDAALLQIFNDNAGDDMQALTIVQDGQATAVWLDFNPDSTTPTDDLIAFDIDFDRAAADTGGNVGLNVHVTTGDMADLETSYGIKLGFDQSANTTATSLLKGLSVENVTGDAQVTETAIAIGTGWDVGLNVGSGSIIIADATYIGSASDT
ncbi:unnamed protein product, partial [marine sediment metagenome]